MEREANTRAAAREEARREVERGTPTTAVVPPEPVNQLGWGPIWAGVITTFALFFIMSLLAIAAGFAVAQFDGGPGNQDVPVDMVAVIVTGIFLAVAFFAGGFVSSWSGILTEEGPAILHGFLVWAVAVLLLLLFAGLGLGQVFGLAGEIFGPQFRAGTGVDLDEQQLQQLTEAFGEAAWQTAAALGLALAASILGALVAIRDEVRRRDWSFGLYGRR